MYNQEVEKIDSFCPKCKSQAVLELSSDGHWTIYYKCDCGHAMISGVNLDEVKRLWQIFCKVGFDGFSKDNSGECGQFDVPKTGGDHGECGQFDTFKKD